MKRLLVADTHVHFYPCYDFGRALASAERNLLQLGQSARGGLKVTAPPLYVLFLTERRDCSFFSDLQLGRLALNDVGFTLETKGERGTITLRSKAGTEILIVAGKQLQTEEKLEVLALGMESEIEEGKSLLGTLALVRERGGIPVLNWSPGKWLFQRGGIVEQAVASGTPDKFLIGDVRMRAWMWGTPRLFRVAQCKGFSIIAGSDPLPFSGEEEMIGSYGSVALFEFDPNAPLNALRAALLRSAGAISTVGSRDTNFSMLHRFIQNETVRRT